MNTSQTPFIRPAIHKYQNGHRHYKKRKLQTNISDEYDRKLLTKILTNQNKIYIKLLLPWPTWNFSKNAWLRLHQASINIIYDINRLKKNCMITKTDAERAFDTIKLSYGIKYVVKLKTEKSFLNIIKNICKKILQPTSYLVMRN